MNEPRMGPRGRMVRLALLSLGLLLALPASGLALQTPPPISRNGQPVTQVATGLRTPTAFAFGDGRVFAADAGSENGRQPGGVYLLNGGRARLLPGSPRSVFGAVWHRGALYLSAGPRLLRWSGFDGSRFTHHRTLYTAPARFPGFNGLGFGADGRIYVGVSVTTDDHGPTTLPYARDLLSFSAAGRGPRIVAGGIRQPWQLAFPRGSSSPFVSVLGQDNGAARPPDFILRVRPGQNYGFPTCNWTQLTVCTPFTRPFKLLPPHTDPMGLGIIGNRLYIAEFGDVLARVVWMPLEGGPLKILLTGFSKPIVALGVSGAYVYVGQTTGQVFRVRATG
jgi:hypothetical protein